MSLISQVFSDLKRKGEAALVGFMVAGDPTPEASELVARALINGGVDILEVGIPFSDPIADGPSIQAAAQRALSSGGTPRLAFNLIQRIKAAVEIPTVILTYYNIIYRMGITNFLEKAKTSGVDGVVVPDLPFDEAEDYRAAAIQAGIDTIFLATPATPDSRLAQIVSRTTGFLYLVSVYGVTGARLEIGPLTVETLKRVKKQTDLPVAVGFGVSKPQHIEVLVSSGADGIIVGSYFSDIVNRHLGDLEAMEDTLGGAASELKAATKRPKSSR